MIVLNEQNENFDIYKRNGYFHTCRCCKSLLAVEENDVIDIPNTQKQFFVCEICGSTNEYIQCPENKVDWKEITISDENCN